VCASLHDCDNTAACYQRIASSPNDNYVAAVHPTISFLSARGVYPNATPLNHTLWRGVREIGDSIGARCSPRGPGKVSLRRMARSPQKFKPGRDDRSVQRVDQQRVIIPKISVIKELLNGKYKFASVPVLDLADTVFSTESLCTD